MSNIHGFELVRTSLLPELSLEARLYRHVRTGAQLLALLNQDENKTFAAAFRTLPHDSTGVAHILEHCVLGGSRKYPVKAPFLELIKGSMATFINAMTYPDFTIYPVASTHLEDFCNLMEVYLDAVFHPTIARHTFEQEGWHFEAQDPAAPFLFRGIVFNEMKGAYSNADELVYTHVQMALLPETAYGVDSGGDPRHIPDLTYDALRTFYAVHYHPSNARLLLSGALPLEDCLRRIDEVLREFEPAPTSPTAALQSRFPSPRRLEIPYPAGEPGAGGQAYAVVGWALAENDDPLLTLALRVLSHALVGSPASALHKALISSGLGEGLLSTPDWINPRQILFFAGLKGVEVGEADRVEPLVLETLASIARDGLGAAAVEAALNTVEFRLRENNAEQGQRGIELMIRALTTWLHDREPLDSLAFETPLSRLKESVARDPQYFEKLIHTYLLDNPHRVTVRMKPDPGLQARQEAEERERLVSAQSAMSADRVQALIRNTQSLKRLQATPDPPEKLATLPMLKRSQLERANRLIPAERAEVERTRIVYHPLPTQGILYLDIGFDLRHLPQELLPYAGLFGTALLELGTQTLNDVQLLQRIERTTGGIRAATFASHSRDSGDGPVWLFLRGKATVDHAPELMMILREVLLSTRLDNRARFREIVLQEKARCEVDLLQRAHEAVPARLRAHFGEADWAADQLMWFGHLATLQQLATETADNWPVVLERLEAIRTRLVNREAMLANITVEPTAWPKVAPHLAGLLAHVPISTASREQWTLPPAVPHEGFSAPTQVNFVGKGADLYRLGYRRHGSALAAAHYLSFTWIWEQLRVQGGAYGGHATFDPLSGVLAFASYRDPNLLRTIQAYDGSADFLRRLELTESELTKSVIGALRVYDPYQLPEAKGFTSLTRLLSGETDTFRQALREELLGTTTQDFAAFAEALQAVAREGHLVILASADQLAQANRQQGGAWLDSRPAM